MNNRFATRMEMRSLFQLLFSRKNNHKQTRSLCHQSESNKPQENKTFESEIIELRSYIKRFSARDWNHWDIERFSARNSFWLPTPPLACNGEPWLWIPDPNTISHNRNKFFRFDSNDFTFPKYSYFSPIATKQPINPIKLYTCQNGKHTYYEFVHDPMDRSNNIVRV